MKFEWKSEQQEAFEKLQLATANCSSLAFPSSDGNLLLRTDASTMGIGAHLLQVMENGTEHTVAFFSQGFNPTQQRWSTIEQEAYGIFASIKHWTHFLWGRTFTVETDHRNLVYIHKCEAAKVVRWKLQLQEYDFIIRHVSGRDNVVADFLSRFPQPSPSDDTIPAVKLIDPSVIAVDDDDDVVLPPAQAGEAAPPDAYSTDDGWNDAASDESFDLHLGFPLESELSLPMTETGDSVHVIGGHDAPTAPPPTISNELLSERFHLVHNSTVGHLGVDATLRRLAEQGHTTHGLRTRVSDLVSGCAVCQKVRLGQGNVIAAVRTTAVQQPFQHLMWDTLGPLPTDESGHAYVLVVLDRFTRFIELIPTPTVSAKVAASALLQVCGRYGIFSTIHSDRGRQFDSALVRNLCAMLRVNQTFGPPYRPQAQGTVERSNRETMRHLRAMMVTLSSGNKWVESLPLVQRIYNSLPNRSTGIAPARLLYGDAINLDRQLLMQVPESDETVTYEACLVQLLASQRQLVQASAAHQQQVVAKALARAPDHPTTYEVGDLVLVLPAAHAPRGKLRPRWFGPMAIVHRESDTYQCQDLNTDKIRHIHVSRLKRYVDDPTVTAADAALWDSQDFLVDSIVSHLVGPTRAAWRFKVRWLDYGPADDSWEPFASVKKTDAFARYIRANNLLRTFPAATFPLDAEG